jgi:hypothetical protein|tara:strand:+ start:144 stop:455 length:312 start_codon:yes stop_codon:yes gene_type:complete
MSLYEYTANEALNLLLGQNGFDVISEHDTTVVAPDTKSWVAIQAIGKDSSGTTEFLKLKVTSNIGDDITSAFFNLIPGEILYGNFSGIVNHTDSTAVCIAYRG